MLSWRSPTHHIKQCMWWNEWRWSHWRHDMRLWRRKRLLQKRLRWVLFSFERINSWFIYQPYIITPLGGPLIISGETDEEDIQVGVLSYGYGCAYYPGNTITMLYYNEHYKSSLSCISWLLCLIRWQSWPAYDSVLPHQLFASSIQKLTPITSESVASLSSAKQRIYFYS